MNEPTSTSVNIIEELTEMGFRNTFTIEEGFLACKETNEKYPPQKISLCGSFRFEGASDPDDSRILYAIEVDDGTRGTIMDGFGIYGDPLIAQFMKDVCDKREDFNLLAKVPSRHTIEIKTAATSLKE